MKCVLPSCFALTLVACAGEPPGTVRVTVSGERLIEEGMGAEHFPYDRWSVHFARFLLVLREVTLANDEGAVGAALPGPFVVDLVRKGEKELGAWELPAGRWSRFSYQVGPMGLGVAGSDAAILAERGASVYVEGVATGPSGELKTFAWSFPETTRYADCHGAQQGVELLGLFVAPGAKQLVELTLHGDHLFYDDLQAESAAPRFRALADADADGDGVIALEELDRVPLYAIPPARGSYRTGALGGVNSLGDFVRTLVHTMGHFRGEGFCNAIRLVPPRRRDE